MSLASFVALSEAWCKTTFRWKKEPALAQSTDRVWSHTSVRWLKDVPSGQRKARRPPRAVHMWYTWK